MIAEKAKSHLFDKIADLHGAFRGGEMVMLYGFNALAIGPGPHAIHTPINEALEIAFYEGMRAATGMGLMTLKKGYREDPEYFQKYFDFQQYKRDNKLL